MGSDMQEAHPQIDAARLTDANINPGTYLATDFLNHFNEMLMLIEMLPSMPECAEDIFAWRPMSYCDYFQQSTFKEKDLAVSVYEHVDAALKARFESLIAKIDEKIFGLIEAISKLEGAITPDALEPIAFSASTEVRPLIDHASALINGTKSEKDWMLAVDHPTAQDEIDRLFD